MVIAHYRLFASGHALMDVLLELPSLDEFLDLVLQDFVLIYSVAMVPMELAIIAQVPFFMLQKLEDFLVGNVHQNFKLV